MAETALNFADVDRITPFQMGAGNVLTGVYLLLVLPAPLPGPRGRAMIGAVIFNRHYAPIGYVCQDDVADLKQRLDPHEISTWAGYECKGWTGDGYWYERTDNHPHLRLED